MDDALDLLMPSVEVNLEVDDSPLVFDDDDEIIVQVNPEMEKYAQEMLDCGYKLCDAEHLKKTFKNLEDVKKVKMHCTGCDKHIGSAPNNLHIRYQHPLLKVLLCGSCFEFYCSGEFEKGEDGSELYCRWCGDGGNVFCCSTCPFVFCRKCIRKNLGRSVAKSIQEQDTWVCLQCDPEQISDHRASYWAMQKYSEQLQEKFKGTDSEHLLSVDASGCCPTTGKKRLNDGTEKVFTPGKKRQNDGTEKVAKTRRTKKPRINPESFLESALLESLRSSPLQQGIHWLDNSDQQDEVVCTPDIIAIDDSPPSSPSVSWQGAEAPPPLAVLPPLVRAPTAPSTSKNTIIVVAPSTQDNHFTARAPGPSKAQPLMWHLPEGLKAKPANASQSQINPQKLSQILNNKIVIPYSKPTAPQVTATKTVTVPAKPPAIPTATVPIPAKSVMPPTPIRVYPRIAPVPPPIPIPPSAEAKQDWFDLALVECSEVTEYISTKIASLSAVHGRSYRSTQLMEELHNTLQTYMHVALEKLQKMKTNTRRNFARDMNERRNASGIVPLARVAVHPKNLPTQSVIPPAPSSLNDNTDDETSSVEHTISDDGSRCSKALPVKATTEKRKNNILITNNVQPEDSLFDMEVTNESDEDEERSCSRATSVTYSEKDQEIIDLLDSSDEDGEARSKSPVLTFPDEVEEQNEENEKSTDQINPSDEEHDSSSKPKNITVLNTEDKEAEIKMEISENPIKEEAKDDKISNGEIKVDKSENDVISEKISTKEAKEITINSEKAELKNGQKMDESEKLEDEEPKLDEAVNSPKVDEIETNNKNKSENEIEEEPMDVEELLSSNVVLRSKKNDKTSNFDAEFSKFIGNSGAISDDELSPSQLSPISDRAETPEIVEKEKTPEPTPAPEEDDDDSLDSKDLDLPELSNKDNGSLSLPPSCDNGSFEDVSNKKVKHATGEIDKNGDLVLDSGILALKQMAENCVTSTMEIQQTTTA